MKIQVSLKSDKDKCKLCVRSTRFNNYDLLNNILVQRVSGIIMPIFRSVRPYNIAYGFQHLMC